MIMIRGHVQNGVVLLDDSSRLPEGAEVQVQLVVPSQNKSAVLLLDTWLQDQSGYDEQTWPELKSELDEHRLSARKLFDGETSST